MTGWSLTYQGFDPREEGLREALCTLGNGYLATRGAAPESHADDVHYPGCYAAGCYNRLLDTVAGETVEAESLVNLPNWLPLTFRIGDGPWFGVPADGLLEYWQELDLRGGVLTRLVRYRDDAGRTTRVTQRRLVSQADPHLCALQTTILAEDWSGRITIRSELDATVENSGIARYRALSGRHLRPVRAGPAGPAVVLLVAETSQSRIRIAEAARTRVLGDDQHVVTQRPVAAGPARAGHEFTVDITPSEPVTAEKVVAIFTSRDRAISEPGTAAVGRLARAGGFDELLERHERAWDRLWARFRFEIDGSELLGTVRLHLFHLMQTLSEHTAELDAGVPPRGLHGEAYRGHVFWDELFVLPILNMRLPHVAEALLRYRHRRLPEARWAAREAGYAGAMFPWQSGSDGREESQRIHLNPASGRWLPDATHRQRHIGIAVAYNVWQHYQATGDLGFLADYGAEMLLDIARFWASIATYDPGRGRYLIRGVVGPDEFHTGYPDAPWDGIDNNAYTNVMAAWVLLRALEVIDLLPEPRRSELTGMLGVTPAETSRWDEISRKLYVPFHEDGVIAQFEGYQELAELDWLDYTERFGTLRRLDRILEAEGDSVSRYQVSKQADVLMLFYLLSAGELTGLLARLGYQWDPELIPQTIEYYLARTSHGSTLSAVVHAWVLARSRRQEAVSFLAEALSADVADVQAGTTAEGIHLAAMAGSVDVLQRCFAGLEIRADTLLFDPYWPGELGTLEFTIRYRGHMLTVQATGKEVRVTAEEGAAPPIRLRCHGELTELGPGESVAFLAPAQ